MTHFLQSEHWRAFNETQGNSTYVLSGPGWTVNAIQERNGGFTRLYVPYGPDCECPRCFAEAVKELECLGRDINSTYLRIEPVGEQGTRQLRDNGYREVASMQPKHTWCVDLTQSHSQIWHDFGAGNRNLYRRATSRGIEMRESTDPADIVHLANLVQELSRERGFRARSPAYLSAQAQSLFPVGAGRLFLAEDTSQVIAASMVYESPTTRYYAHAAVSRAQRKVGAGNALMAHMILDAKARGLTEFDMWGITTSEDPEHPWAGFTKFKKSFGGYQKSYAGTWEKPLHHVAYSLYSSARKALNQWQTVRFGHVGQKAASS